MPEAQAAYDRLTHFMAQPGDVDLVIAAAQQGGMPQPIVDFGAVVKTDKDAFGAYEINPSPANTEAWMAADAAIRKALN